MNVRKIKNSDLLITPKSYFPFSCSLLTSDPYTVMVIPGSIILASENVEFVPIDSNKTFKLKEGEGIFLRVFRKVEKKEEEIILSFPTGEEGEKQELTILEEYSEIDIDDIKLITKEIEEDEQPQEDSEEIDIRLCSIENGELIHSFFQNTDKVEKTVKDQASQNYYQQLYINKEGSDIFTSDYFYTII